MTEQQNPHRSHTRETSPLRVITGVDEKRSRSALDDRCKAMRRWIYDDDDSCCRGID